jgi:hypothetical protein
VLQISASKKIPVWMDINPYQEICVPHNKGKIRIKVLKLPKNVSIKNVVQGYSATQGTTSSVNNNAPVSSTNRKASVEVK